MKPVFDPVPRALEIHCPTCGAKPENWCKTPKRTKRKNLHTPRLDMVR